MIYINTIKRCLCFFSILFSVNAFSESSFIVQSVRGAAFCGDQSLKKGDRISEGCKIETHANSNLYIKNEENIISFGDRAKGEVKSINLIVLESGMMRLKLKTKLIIETKQSKVDLDPGDYLSRVSSIFGETEMLIFNGSAKLVSQIIANDFVEITTGHWGGVGGRFSQKIGNLVKLTDEQGKVFQSILN